MGTCMRQRGNVTTMVGKPSDAKGPCQLDADGFLTAPKEWNKQAAQVLAESEGLKLSETHWLVIRFLRDSYIKSKTVPSMRDIRESTGLSVRDLFSLFPAGGPLMQGVKIAGLPKPSGCK